MALGALALLVQPIEARGDDSVLVAPESGPVMAAPVEAAPLGAMCDCCPRPRIDYRTHRSARKMLRCQGDMQTVVVAENPADCCACPVEVPMCIPACCTGLPSWTSDRGLLGRGIVEYCWPCGFSAKVVFKHNGDIKVRYRG